MTSYSSFIFPASSVESTVFLKLSSPPSTGGGGVDGQGGPPFFPPIGSPTPRPQSTSSSFVQQQSSTSSQFGFSSVSSSVSSTAPTSSSASALSATISPQIGSAMPPHHRPPSPVPIIIGATIGGFVLGALIVTLVFFLRRRRAQRRAPQDQQAPVNPFIQDEEKKTGSLDEPAPETSPTAPNTKVMDWIQRNRVVSVSTISSFSSPTVLESVGARTSISAYSQASVLASGTSGDLSRPEPGGFNRLAPPGLHPINE
ncbi:hypothetical protein DFH07DRAFT_993849 [Mycena maculata]|uniref:Uncharacterized protein n=1 Tax=Mycena maculata TaxID=230809 RepID=A0AAD7JXW0_9AGAR|nr:hypothetical protein DFH07DRAFT_993849 [Mycena maculata]